MAGAFDRCETLVCYNLVPAWSPAEAEHGTLQGFRTFELADER